MKFDKVKDAITSIEANVTNCSHYSTIIVVMDEDYKAANTKAQLVEQTLINLGFRAKELIWNALNIVNAYVFLLEFTNNP